MGHSTLRPPRTNPGETLSRDTVFSTLSNERRRYVLQYLRAHPGERVRIRDLATQIAAWENDVSVDDLVYNQRKCVYTSLHQTHLPKMNDFGIVDYDRDRGLITATPLASDLDTYLDGTTDDFPWGPFYLGLSSISLLLVGVAWAGVLPFDGLPPLAYAALVSITFAVVSGVHVALRRPAGRITAFGRRLRTDDAEDGRESANDDRTVGSG